jgi:hypothetical protein
MYFEFLFERARSRSRAEWRYSSGVSLNSSTICSNKVGEITIGPGASGLPHFGLPRRFVIVLLRVLLCSIAGIP